MAVKTVNIVQGEDISLTIDLKDHNTGDPFPLTGFQGATAFFLPADGTTSVAVSGSLVSADLGRLNFALTEANTAAMQAADAQDFEVQVEVNSKKTIAQILGKLNVAASLAET